MSSLTFDNLPISAELLPPRFSLKTISAMCSLIVFGAINVVLFKLQTSQFGLKKDAFQIQVFFVFSGQFLNIIFFYLRFRCRRYALIQHFRHAQRQALFDAKAYRFGRCRIFWAALLNFIAVYLQLQVLTHLSPLLFQMFLSVGAVFTPLISCLALGRRIYSHTVVGMALCVLGFVSMFLIAYFFSFQDVKFDGNLVYILVFLFLSLLSSSCQSVYEEWVTERVVISAFRFAGLEGIFGIIILTVVGLACQLFATLSDTPFYSLGADIWSISQSQILVRTSLILICSSALYGLSAISLTKSLTATLKMMTDILKVILIWMAQILFFDIERPDIDTKHYLLLNGLRLAAYSFVVLGHILINEIVELPCLGLSKHWGKYAANKLNNSYDPSDEYSVFKF